MVERQPAKPTTAQLLRMATVMAMYPRNRDLLIKAADELDHLRIVMMECSDSIRDQDDMGALRMLEVALNG